MATENVEAASGSGGPRFASDTETVGTLTINHPLTKIEWGPEDSFTLVNTGTASLPIQGAASENATASANPLLAGGRYDSAARTLGNGDVGALALNQSGHALVDTGTVTVTGTVVPNGTVTTVPSGTQAVSGTLTVGSALPAGSNAIGKLAANSGVDIGDVDVTSISAGANLIGDVGLSGARTSGGTTLYKNIDVDESEDQVKGTAGQIYWIHAINLKATPLYLKIYNATAASVTVGTTVPDLTFPVPSSGDTNGSGFTISIPNGISFGTAITIAATTGVADNDSGAPGANELIVNLGYA